MRNLLKYSDDGIITLEGFERVNDNQKVTIKIFGPRRVVITLNKPNEMLDCHNVITVLNHKCYNPELVTKLIAAGVEQNSYFTFISDAYYISL